MNTNEELRKELHERAANLLKKHAGYTRQIVEAFELRIEIERELEQIDAALNFYRPIRSPLSRLDSQGGEAE